MTSITIVVPVKNELKNLEELVWRIDDLIQLEQNYYFELLFIDNASTDGSSDFIKKMAMSRSDTTFIRFTRDFGIEASFDAGAKYSRGDALIYLFSDLQDPPELIPHMIRKWEEGNDLVYGKLQKRSDSVYLKSIGAKIAYKMIASLSNQKIPENATDFRLISRRLINHLNSFSESSRYMRGITHWTGVRSTSIEYSRSPRKFGKSKAGLIFCTRYAIDVISSFSTKPLRIAAIVGLALICLSSLLGMFYFVNSILATIGVEVFPVAPRGWSTITILILLFGGVNSFLLGILGEYVGKTLNEVKKRPLWIIDDCDLKLADNR